MFNKEIRIDAAARLIGVTPQTLRNWDKSSKLPAHRSRGGHRYYELKELQPYLKSIDALGWLWATSDQSPQIADEYYCERQDRFSSRLTKMGESLVRDTDSKISNLASLLTLVAGEIGDNSFAHNLGSWPNVPGVFFGCDAKRKLIVLADRGQGVLATLQRVKPTLHTDRAAIKTAFTEILSGRNPEKRGNGLKVVRSVVESNSIRLLFQSGTGVIMSDKSQGRLRQSKSELSIHGTYTVIKW